MQFSETLKSLKSLQYLWKLQYLFFKMGHFQYHFHMGPQPVQTLARRCSKTAK